MQQDIMQIYNKILECVLNKQESIKYDFKLQEFYEKYFLNESDKESKESN